MLLLRVQYGDPLAEFVLPLLQIRGVLLQLRVALALRPLGLRDALLALCQLLAEVVLPLQQLRVLLAEVVAINLSYSLGIAILEAS